MEFAFSQEQLALKDHARRFLNKNAAMDVVRESLNQPWHDSPAATLWQRMADELGWTSLNIAERYGGSECGCVELAVVMEELGRALTPVPFLSTVCMAATALGLLADEEQKERYLPAIASGEITATVLQLAAGGTARAQDGGWCLDGEVPLALDGALADLLIVSTAPHDSEPSRMFLVPATSQGVSRRMLPTMDGTRQLAEVSFAKVRVERHAELGMGREPAATRSGQDAIERVHDVARVALAAEQLGGAERCLDMAVEYAKQRHQFGRAIGSFQAIKHKCADMLLQVECARSAVYYAAWVATHQPGELRTAAALAKIACSEAYFHCAGENIQIHGGIGFTWEHDAHLHFKRARAARAWLGTPGKLRERLAEAMGI